MDMERDVEIFDPIQWCLDHRMFHQAMDNLIHIAECLLINDDNPCVFFLGRDKRASLRQLERATLLNAVQLLDRNQLTPALMETLVSQKVQAVRKLVDDPKDRFMLYSIMLSEPEMTLKEQLSFGKNQLIKLMYPVFGEKTNAILEGKEKDISESCFLAVDLARAMFKTDAKGESTWREHSESKNWVKTHHPEWLCYETDGKDAFESRGLVWIENGPARNMLLREIPSASDLFLFLADEDRIKRFLVPFFSVGGLLDSRDLLPRSDNVPQFLLNGCLSIPAFTRVLLDLYFIGLLNDKSTKHLECTDENNTLTEAQKEIFHALYLTGKSRNVSSDKELAIELSDGEYCEITLGAWKRLSDLRWQADCMDDVAAEELSRYRVEESPSNDSASFVDKLPEVKEIDPMVDEYSESKPRIKDLLIVSLSTFPVTDEIKESRFCYTKQDGTVKTGEYYYQQEPFPKKLLNRLRKHGEILMLTSPETREKTRKLIAGKTVYESPQSYFMKTAKKDIPDIIFKSIALDLDNPSSAVSEVVEHLREIKRNNLLESNQNNSNWPRIHLGTNGGLRSNQLILEAVLSLLRTDGITISPKDVWSMKPSDEKGKWEVFNSAAEFRIFDFVSGINEFIQYGRIDLLEKFWEGDTEHSRPKLMDHIKTIANGIRFNDIATLESGIKDLRDYFFSYSNSSEAPMDTYIQMFVNAIRDDYGSLLVLKNEANPNEPPCVLDEIRWCVKKGLYIQAYTIAETRLPIELFERGIIQCDAEGINAAAEFKDFAQQDERLALFNKMISRITTSPVGNPRKLRSYWFLQNNSRKGYESDIQRGNHLFRYYMIIPQYFEDSIIYHFQMKDLRNPMCHPGKDIIASPDRYHSVIENYIGEISNLYQEWGNSFKEPIVLRLVSSS